MAGETDYSHEARPHDSRALRWLFLALGFVFVGLGIVGALALAGRAMLRDGRDGQPKTNRMVRALALRVALSVALFLFILISYKLGWIQPTGIPVGS